MTMALFLSGVTTPIRQLTPFGANFFPYSREFRTFFQFVLFFFSAEKNLFTRKRRLELLFYDGK